MHIQFNISGEVEQRLTVRGRLSSPAMAAKQDLLDFWRLADEGIPTFSLPEARLLLDALNGSYPGIATAHLLWASVSDAWEGGLAQKWEVGCGALVARLRALDRLDAIRVVRAVAYAWDCISGGRDIDDAIRSVRLVGGE